MENFNRNKSAIRTQISNYHHKFVLTNQILVIFDVLAIKRVASNAHSPSPYIADQTSKTFMCVGVYLCLLFFPSFLHENNPARIQCMCVESKAHSICQVLITKLSKRTW